MKFTCEEWVEYPTKRRVTEWEFNGEAFRMLAVRCEERKSNRHKFKKVSGWSWLDDSRRVPTPNMIPIEHVVKARQFLQNMAYKVPVYIGWYAKEHEVKQKTFGGSFETTE